MSLERKWRTGLRLALGPVQRGRDRLPVSVRLCELMARDADDLAVGQVIRPPSRDRRLVMCMPHTVPSEGV